MNIYAAGFNQKSKIKNQKIKIPLHPTSSYYVFFALFRWKGTRIRSYHAPSTSHRIIHSHIDLIPSFAALSKSLQTFFFFFFLKKTPPYANKIRKKDYLLKKNINLKFGKCRPSVCLFVRSSVCPSVGTCMSKEER